MTVNMLPDMGRTRPMTSWFTMSLFHYLKVRIYIIIRPCTVVYEIFSVLEAFAAVHAECVVCLALFSMVFFAAAPLWDG